VYGTPQLVEEAMTTGEAGLQLQQQRQQALQSYLSSGQTPGDIAFNVYNQQQNQLRASQGAALSYLGSGSTPYQVGSQAVQQAQGNAATAAQGGPQYNPQSLQPNYSGTAQQFPQYGLDIGQQAQNYYNSMSAQNAALASGGGQNKGMSALTGGLSGALSGAASGAVLGSIIPGLGNLIGAGIGAAVGGALGAGSSYFG
jgi:hypothetical protein